MKWHTKRTASCDFLFCVLKNNAGGSPMACSEGPLSGSASSGPSAAVSHVNRKWPQSFINLPEICHEKHDYFLSFSMSPEILEGNGNRCTSQSIDTWGFLKYLQWHKICRLIPLPAAQPQPSPGSGARARLRAHSRALGVASPPAFCRLI